MKKVIALLIFMCGISVNAQIYDPVKWDTKVEKIGGGEYNLVITATIDKGWHLYSVNVPENGPVPTTFAFDNKADKFELVGEIVEPEGHVVNDEIFEMKIKYFSDKAVFKQKIKASDIKDGKINGEVEFMVCNDTSCLPPTYVDLVFVF